MKKAAIYDPYLDTLGGGEKYCLTVAEILLQHNYQVDLFWSGDPLLLAKAQKRFNLNLTSLNQVPDIFNIAKANFRNDFDSRPDLSQKLVSLYQKFSITRQYDLFFFLSDGSIPLLFSKQNFLHTQVPFLPAPLSIKSSLAKLLKLSLIKKIICNSKFTQKFVNQAYSHNTTVLYPPVDTTSSSNSSKDNIILSVGRFDNILNAKKQDVLIEVFKKLPAKIIKNWTLVLAGGSLLPPPQNTYLTNLKKISRGFPVRFMVNPDYASLQDVYRQAKIYWHAAGYGVDESSHPQNTEHFGITVVESMNYGLVPLVIAKGGLPEIVLDNHNGFLWSTTDELLSKTLEIISSPTLFSRLSHQARLSSLRFSKNNFTSNFLSLIQI
ncbi:MAG: glycosyltransferase family 4 protein [Candidatus Shapirobacteria bacterium]|jgi:glycosyltransferase involved in cell wall biosynthesis